MSDWVVVTVVIVVGAVAGGIISLALRQLIVGEIEKRLRWHVEDYHRGQGAAKKKA